MRQFAAQRIPAWQMLIRDKLVEQGLFVQHPQHVVNSVYQLSPADIPAHEDKAGNKSHSQYSLTAASQQGHPDFPL